MSRLWVALGAVLAAMLTPYSAVAQGPDGGDVGDELAEAPTIQNWELALAFVNPLILAAVIRLGWSHGQKAVAAFAWCLFATAIGTWLRDGYDVLSTDWLSSALKVFVATIPFYYGLWKPTGVAPAIERRTG
jgi:hypothetical protein